MMLIPDFGTGGAERIFGQIGQELAHEHRVIECVFNGPTESSYVSGNEVVQLGVPAGRNLLTKAFNFLLRVYRLRRLKRVHRVDVCISHLEGADYVNVLSRIHDATILCVHGTKLHDGNIKGVLGWIRLKMMLPFLYKKSSHVVCVSDGIKKELTLQLGLPGDKVSVIYNSFDINAIRKSSMEPLPNGYLQLMVNHEVIVTSGRLAPEKNQQILVRLMPQLIQSRPNIKLVILGAGVLGRPLAEEARHMGLRVQEGQGSLQTDNHVFLPGYFQNPFPFLRSARLFALPSLWEGFPLALCEALICGVPVIAHDCPTGPREILAPDFDMEMKLTHVLRTECGVLIPYSKKQDLDTLAHWRDEILKLLDDESLRTRLVAGGHMRALAFGKKPVMKAWTDLIGKYA